MAIFKSFCMGWLGLLVPFKHGFDQGQFPEKVLQKILYANFGCTILFMFIQTLTLLHLMLHGHSLDSSVTSTTRCSFISLEVVLCFWDWWGLEGADCALFAL
jgi:hypothetical protein